MQIDNFLYEFIYFVKLCYVVYLNSSNPGPLSELPVQPQSSKPEEGLTDARNIWGYVPFLNLLQSDKSLPIGVRTTLNWLLTSISIISNVVFTVLKVAGIGIAILSGPIGWAISLGLFALSVVISLIAYKIAAKDPEGTFNKAGYQVNSSQFDADNFLDEDRTRIRVSSELCEKLSEMESPQTVSECAWPEKLMGQQDALREAGFKFAGGSDTITLDDGRSVAVQQFQNISLGISFAIAVDPDGSTYFVPALATNHSERMAALACAACPWKDARTEAFDAAFQSVLMAYGDDVIPTGDHIGGMFAQFLGLKYGCETFCYNPYGIGPIHQQIIGMERMAKNAPQVFNFTVRKLQTPLQRFSDAIDLPLTLFTSYQTPGTFGRRFELPDSQQTAMSRIMREAFAGGEMSAT
jgi:hypothetical protein